MRIRTMQALAFSMVVGSAAPVAAQTRYFEWRPGENGKIYAWMSDDVAQVFGSRGLRLNQPPGTASPGAMMVRDSSGLYNGVFNGWVEANGMKLRIVEFYRSLDVAGQWIALGRGIVTFTMSGNTISGTIGGAANDEWNRVNKGGTVSGTVNGMTATCIAQANNGDVVEWRITFSADGRSASVVWKALSGPNRGASGTQSLTRSR